MSRKRIKISLRLLILAMVIDVSLLVFLERVQFNPDNFILNIIDTALWLLFPGFILLGILLRIEAIKNATLQKTLRLVTLLLFLFFTIIIFLGNNFSAGFSDVSPNYTKISILNVFLLLYILGISVLLLYSLINKLLQKRH